VASPSSNCAPLQGVRVLDLTRAVAGPFCTLLLGDLGARVVKIEEPETGDETRHWGPHFIDGESVYFLALNRNKQSVVLDLKRESDLAALRQLAAQADVVVQNFRPGVVERLGIDYETLKAGNPGLIYASISGFGITGPDRQRPGYDLIVQAMSGMMLASGSEGAPAKSCFPVADVLAGQFACQAILAALYERRTTGRGTHVEVSLLESLLFAMTFHSTACLLTGVSPEPQGTNSVSIAPYQLLRCQDAPLAVGVPNDRIWRRFCDALDRRAWADDARYSTNQRRIENRAALIQDIEAVMGRRTSAEWLEILDRHQVPCGPLLSIADIFQHPHVVARDNAVEVDHPSIGPVKLVADPMRFLGREMEYRPPPVLGQDTAAVLNEILATDSAAADSNMKGNCHETASTD
jgi:crotonobetainyl-CoA:carnitine CoA-transferase CaiB-like acyl-CoA transferase